MNKLTFEELLVKRRGKDFMRPERLLCLDPGETTGWALFEDGKLANAGHSATKDRGWHEIARVFKELQPTMMVFENYRIYQHKLDRHSYSEVYTLRLIGVIEYLCDVEYKIPRYTQMAHQAKGFVKDERLREWDMYKVGHRHARDAIRHGCYFLLFDSNLR